MKHSLHFKLRLLLLLVLFSIGAISVFAQNQSTSGIQPGKVHVKFKPSMSATLSSLSISKAKSGYARTGMSAFDAVASSYKAVEIKPLFIAKPGKEEAHRRHGLHLWYEVTIDQKASALMSANDFKNLGDVAHAEPIYAKSFVEPTSFTEAPPMGTSAAPTNDPGLGQQWHYENDGSNNGIVEADINLFEAWETTKGSSDVVVSVHDQGVDANHEDLAANMWVNTLELNGEAGVDDDFNGFIDDIHGFDFVNNSGNVPGEDHGTHVAGTVSAVNNNGIGVAGVAGGSGANDGAKIMTMKAIGGNMAASFAYAADNGALISQNSWTYTSPNVYEQAVLDAIDYFIAEAGNYVGSPMKGGLVVFAAGNYNSSATYYPEAYEPVLTVAALGRSNQKAYYSNYAPWVDIAAPGGDQSQVYGGSIGGVLSTLPGNGYGFYQGTSMACPHVSGIAALVVAANGGTNFTNDDLYTHLITGTHDIYEYNPSFEGMLGVGYIDAALAIKADNGIAPDQVADLSINTVSQDFVDLMWTTVGDEDDETAFGYEIYFGTDSVDVVQKSGINTSVITDNSASGTMLSHTIEDLIPETKYYFGISAFDRWGNKSIISTVTSAITTDAPEIAFDVTELSMTLDNTNAHQASDIFNVINNADGALKWNAEIRQTRGYSLSTSSINYPVSNGGTLTGVGQLEMAGSSTPEVGTSDYDNDFTSKSWRYGPSISPLFIIGEEDLTIPNSAATRFEVTDPEGFNLTRISQFMNFNRNVFPEGVLEIYEGESIDKKSLVLVQEFTGNSYDGGGNKSITLDHQLFFEPGEVFWVVFHMPVGIQYPLGIGQETASMPSQSDNCFMSFDVGKTWVPLEDAIEDDSWVWRTELQSTIQPIHEYLTLSSTEGVTPGTEQQEITVDADGTKLINGRYYASAVFYSNDDNNRVAEVEFTVNVNDHQPALSSVSLVDFGNTFVGVPKTVDIPLENSGLGVFKFNDANCISSNADFDLGGTSKSGIPFRIDALDSDVLTVVFTPTAAGNLSGQIVLEDYNGNQHTINVSGVGTAPSEIEIPVDTTSFTMAIGEIQSGSFDIVNNGNYPLQYYMPKYVTNDDVIQVPYTGNAFGYSWEHSNDAGASISYSWEDISTTGEEVSDYWRGGSEPFYEIDLGFEFPLFEQTFEKLYLTAYGVLTTHTDIGVVGNRITPGSASQNVQISSLNKQLRLSYGGEIYVQRKSGRLIIQYESVQLSSSSSTALTFQTIIYNNGDVVHNYKDVPSSSYYSTATIALEDPDKKFGFLAYDATSATPDVPDADLTDMTSIKVFSPGVDAVENLSSTTGVVPVGQTQTITFDVNSSELNEGSWYNRLVIASNDPTRPLSSFVSLIDVNSGGAPNIEMTTTAIDMGSIFEGDSTGRTLEIRNTGNKAVMVDDATLLNGNFELESEPLPFELEAKTSYFMSIGHNGVAQGTFTDELTFDFSDGSQETVDLSLVVGPAPGIFVTTDPIDYNLNVGETAAHTVTVENTGEAELEYTTSGTEWAYFNDDAVATSNLSENDYIWKSTFDDGSVGYNWEEIVETGGEQLDNGEQSEWHTKDLPFEFDFYGNTYSTIYIHSNGFITFDDQTDFEFSPIGEVQQSMPDPELINNVIAPYWAQGWYSNVSAADRPITGVFYKAYDDYVIVEFARMRDRAFLGHAFSVQAIIYKNGNIKYQYNLDQTSRVYEGIVGIENQDGTDGKQVVAWDFFIEDKLAVIFNPAKKRTLASGQSASLDLTIDATHTNGGTYNSNLFIQSNVPGNLNQQIPATLTVSGAPEIGVPDSVDFGDIVAETLPNGDIVNHNYDFVLTNTGTDHLSVTTGELLSGEEYELNKLDVFCGFRGCSEILTPIDGAFTLELDPGDEQQIRVTLNTRLATYEARDTVIFDQGLATEVRIPVYANVFLPAVLDIDNDAFHFEASNADFADTGTITLDNTTGQDALVYDLILDYNRQGISMAQAMSDSGVSEEELVKTEEVDNSIPMETSSDFNRTLMYGADENNTYLGFGPSSTFSSSTKFNAGADGFNLSHVSTYFSSENSTSSRIVVEIYAGKDIYDAVKVSETEYTHESELSFKGFVTIPLEETVKLYPHETFFVTIRYPFGIGFPQGVNLVEDTPNTFLFKSGAFWYDMQTSGFSGFGWYVKALEENYEATGWVELSTTGFVPAGETGTVDINVFAANVDQADVSANVIINSNDPYNPTATASVSMHLNQAPVFAEVENTYSVNETETLEFSISANDVEGESISYALIGNPAGMTLDEAGEIATISFTPDYEAAGTYNFSVEATDSNGGANLFNVGLEVVDVNRTPTAATMTDLELNIDAQDHIIDAATIFSDEDADALTYRAEISDGSIANVFASASEFMVDVVNEGQTTVTLYATDGRSAEISASFNLSVVGQSNTAPYSAGLSDMEVNIDAEPIELSGSEVFSDDDGDVLIFRTSSSGQSIAIAAATDSGYILTPKAEGATTITLYATDNLNDEVSVSFTLTVIGQANVAPEAISLEDLTMVVGETHMIDPATVFADAEDDAMDFRATSSNEAAVDVLIVDGNFEIVPVHVGNAIITLFATDNLHDEVSVSFEVSADYVLAVEDEFAIQLSVYPNPVIDRLTIAVDQSSDHEIRLYNIAGNVMMTRVVPIDNQTASLDMSQMKAGVYILEVASKERKLMRRIIKK